MPNHCLYECCTIESFKKTLGKSSAITWATVIDCYKNEANAVQKAAAEATPSHQYTAWIIVNNRHIEDGNALLYSICEAYEGVKPQSCAAATSLNVVEGTRKKSSSWGSSFIWTEQEKKQSVLSERWERSDVTRWKVHLSRGIKFQETMVANDLLQLWVGFNHLAQVEGLLVSEMMVLHPLVLIDVLLKKEFSVCTPSNELKWQYQYGEMHQNYQLLILLRASKRAVDY